MKTSKVLITSHKSKNDSDTILRMVTKFGSDNFNRFKVTYLQLQLGELIRGNAPSLLVIFNRFVTYLQIWGDPSLKLGEIITER